MNTPIYDFVKAYAERGMSRFHMPGHKGKSFLGAEKMDITEIKGADLLYSAEGIIAESENNCSALFGTAHSFYSTEGSTLCIKAMLALASGAAAREGRARILASRGSHKALLYAAALLDIDVDWIYPPSGHLASAEVSSASVRAALDNSRERYCAVYITSPDYLGNICDVSEIASVCHEHSLPLLVDNAHGAYLGFLTPSRHPIALGADMCCDSAHKTLPVLTGGAYLHISKAADKSYTECARAAFSLFASTSPSYLILSSLDICNRYLSEDYGERLTECIAKLDGVKRKLCRLGFCPEQSEPLKLVVKASKYGYSGTELSEHLRAHMIEAEYADVEYTVLMATPENGDEDFSRICEAFETLPLKAPLNVSAPKAEACTPCMGIRDAILAPSEAVTAMDAVGRICSDPAVSCPPAVPIVISGERISAGAAALFVHYGIESVRVVKE